MRLVYRTFTIYKNNKKDEVLAMLRKDQLADNFSFLRSNILRESGMDNSMLIDFLKSNSAMELLTYKAKRAGGSRKVYLHTCLKYVTLVKSKLLLEDQEITREFDTFSSTFPSLHGVFGIISGTPRKVACTVVDLNERNQITVTYLPLNCNLIKEWTWTIDRDENSIQTFMDTLHSQCIEDCIPTPDKCAECKKVLELEDMDKAVCDALRMLYAEEKYGTSVKQCAKSPMRVKVAPDGSIFVGRPPKVGMKNVASDFRVQYWNGEVIFDNDDEVICKVPCPYMENLMKR